MYCLTSIPVQLWLRVVSTLQLRFIIWVPLTEVWLIWLLKSDSRDSQVDIYCKFWFGLQIVSAYKLFMTRGFIPYPFPDVQVSNVNRDSRWGFWKLSYQLNFRWFLSYQWKFQHISQMSVRKLCRSQIVAKEPVISNTADSYNCGHPDPLNNTFQALYITNRD